MILSRTLRGLRVEGHAVLDAQAGPAGQDGSREVRVFLGTGTEAERIAARDGMRPATVLVTAKSLVVTGRWDGQGAGVPLPVTGTEARLDWDAPELDLLTGRNVLLGTRNGEAPEIVADWLTYHAEHHGIGGAVILDRTRPDEAGLAESLDADDLPDIPVVVVTSPLPLGTAEPSERDGHTAPEARGSGDAAGPEDRWTSRLGELAVLEALRWRFLARARGVAWLDVSDLLAPEARLFERLAGSASGVMALAGRRVYPWRVRGGAGPGFGDHVCTPVPPGSANRRWAAAPMRLPPEAAFRMVRIGGVAPDPGPPVPFLRAMALRHSEADGALAARRELRPDETLVALARDAFDHDPVLPQRAAATVAPLRADLPGRTAIVTCMRNEGPFVLEWLAHHRGIGVDDFLIYTNDCTDGTDVLLDRLQAAGIVQHRPNPFREMGVAPQHGALTAAEGEPVLHRSAWHICMDVDEYLNVHVGEGRLSDLYGSVGDANLISATWRLFGNSDHAAFDPAPTPERFTRCAPQEIRKPHQAWGFKTLVRNLGLYRKLGVHRPKGLNPGMWEHVRWVNGSGAPMPQALLRAGWRSTSESVGYDLVTLNHYAVRDAESFLVKRHRGRANHVGRDQGLAYWFRMNNNAEKDRSIARRSAVLRHGMAALLALPGVATAHADCVAAHRARIAELRADPAFARLYAELVSPRMRRLSRMHAHFGGSVFLAGPQAVPDEVVFADHPPGFAFSVDGVGRAAH